MAQRTAAERFLASVAKTTSARAFLALVAAASLALLGCGGGSSSSNGQSETAGSGGAGGSGAAKTTASAPAGPAGGSDGETAKPGSEGSDSGPGTAPARTGAKHGPPVAAPKGPAEQAPTPKQVANATIADISLQSPAIVASTGRPGRLASTYTCDGKDSWPALRWGGVPPGTTELALFVMNMQPVNEEIFVDWAVAGLEPGLDEIKAGELPKGAILGTNGFGKRGYSICPPGGGEIYMFALYALPRSLSPAKGFDPLQLRKEVLGASGNVGLLPAVYERG